MPPLRDRTTWLHGDQFGCLQPSVAHGRTWRLVLLGPPGVGKGTQAEMLGAVLGACPLSTGDVFRAGRERSFAPGSAMAEAEARMERGELVPDDLVLGLIRNRRNCLRCGAGFLLDGYPRTIRQAVALDGLLELERLRLDAVISYDLPLPQLEARMAGRRVCESCQALYHVDTRPPRRGGICDHCGGALVQRLDDRPAAVHARLEAYVAAATEVAEFYRRRGLLLQVYSGDSAENIFARTLQALAERGFIPSRAADRA